MAAADTGLVTPLAHDASGPSKGSGSKVAVIGSGAVGIGVAYSMINQGLVSSLALIDLAEDKVKGEVMDLQHGSAFMHEVEVVGGSDYALAAGAKLAIVTAGVRSRTDESRLELLGRNVKVFESKLDSQPPRQAHALVSTRTIAEIIPSITKHAPDAVILIVTNPVDIMTQVAARLAGLAPGRVLGSGTSLDSSRFRSLISKKLKVATRSVHAYILGEHGDSSVPVWSQACVGCTPIEQWVPGVGTPDGPPEWNGMHKQVTGAAYEVIAAKGYTNLAIGLSTAAIAKAILRDERCVLPVSVHATGKHGIEQDVYLSLPAVIGAGGVHGIVNCKLEAHEAEALRHSAATLHATAEKFM